MAALLLLLPLLVQDARASTLPQTGPWRAWLESPGGELAFGLELEDTGSGWRARVQNGEECLVQERVELTGDTLTLRFAPYDSYVEARLSQAGRRLDGQWKRYQGKGAWSTMAFHADAGARPRYAPLAGASVGPSTSGRYAVRFAQDEEPAVGIFDEQPDGRVLGTFLTALGDYRYLEGRRDGSALRLSCFDGAHAFLFVAELGAEGRLAGTFYSRDAWQEAFEGQRDEQAELSDPDGLTRAARAVDWHALAFPDLEGEVRRLDDPAFQGRARLIVLFGSWCPNCNDLSHYLVELDSRFRAAGLAIQGLAFELDDDLAANRERLRRYARHHDAHYPILIAGPADKQEASRRLPFLDRLRAYPTVLIPRDTEYVQFPPVNCTEKVHSAARVH